MTQDAAQPRKGPGFSAVAGWPLRRKLALALAIPLLLAATLGLAQVQGEFSASRQAASSAKQVTIIQPAIDYLTASETALVAAQSDSAADQGDLIDAIDDIITNGETLSQARDSADLNDFQAANVDALLDLSQAMRTEGADELGPATWIALVRQLESNVSQLITSVNAAQESPEPRLEQISQNMSGRLSLALQQGLLATSLAQSSSQDLFSEIGVEAAAIDRLAGSVEGAEEQTSALRSANTRHASQIKADKGVDFDGRDAYVAYDAITAQLIGGVTDSLDQAASSAQRNALLGALGTLISLAAAIFIALVIARSLLEPIGRVREGALAVARHRLPDAVARIRAGQEPEPIKTIDVTTNEEIGQVARAVDDLHRQAIHLASGEAQLRQTVNAMFVTLSRRSNSLVNQQLAQIERLEHDEEDPKRLESLFRLDHLASRMRRTADSLLILADAPNRNAGQFSLTAGEALQAATSAVQDYQRVQILSNLSTRIGDGAAPDVVHLLTELVDNALTYSPPGEPVRLAAKLEGDGVTITITDAGLGVPPAELELLNADLAHGSEATPDTARRMGLFVVSRLAERHGVNVQLSRNLGGGMTATVVLPPAILPDLPQPAAPAAPATSAKAAPASVASKTVETTSSPAESRRETRKGSRAEKAAERAAEKSAANEARTAERAKAAEKAAADKTAADKAAADKTAAEKSAVDTSVEQDTIVPGDTATPDRPSLDSLLPRREPGANIPRTGADAFLPPETSGATGPLFGKREATSDEDGTAADAAPAAKSSEDTPASSRMQRVASVVPITALASRQRAQAEQAKGAQDPVVEPVAEPAAEEAVEEPARAYDPLSDPLSDPLPQDELPGSADTTDVETDEPAAEPAAEVDHDHDDVEVDVDDPLGLGGTSRHQDPEPVAEPAAEESSEESTEEPAEELTVAEESAVEEPSEEPDEATSVEEPAASVEADPAPNGVDRNGAEPGHNGGESPIFKSMRSGWLDDEGESEFHQTEIDRGWERAVQVEETAVAASTVTGLPRRAPGERLVPGSVTPPTAAKTRDPEAIRRRLQAHKAGVSRGRQAVQSSSQHTEAGPA